MTSKTKMLLPGISLACIGAMLVAFASIGGLWATGWERQPGEPMGVWFKLFTTGLLAAAFGMSYTAAAGFATEEEK